MSEHITDADLYLADGGQTLLNATTDGEFIYFGDGSVIPCDQAPWLLRPAIVRPNYA